MITVTDLVKTCEACPAQWEGWADDGRMVYVQYRWGYLSVRVSPKPTRDVRVAASGPEVFGAHLNDCFDGELSFTDLRSATIGEVAWPREGRP